MGLDDVFGDGADGDATLSTDTTLSRDMYYGNLTLGTHVTLHPNGYRIFVQGVLTLGDGAAIRRDGASAGPGQSATMTAGTLGAGGTGQTDSPCNSTGGNTSNSLGGNAGAQGGVVFGTATAPSASVGGTQIFDSVTSAIAGRTLDGAQVTGGAGGENCGPQQYGGGGGGVIVLVARTIVLSGASATISADGGNAATSAPPGFPPPWEVGGGGGVIVVVTTSPPPAGLTLSVAGGNSVEQATPGASGSTHWLD